MQVFAETDCPKTFFFVGMFNVFQHNRIIVAKYCGSFLEWDAVFFYVGYIFIGIPFNKLAFLFLMFCGHDSSPIVVSLYTLYCMFANKTTPNRLCAD